MLRTQATGNATGVGSNPGPEIGALLGNWSSDGRTLHLTLVVDNDPRVVFKVEKSSIFSPKRFSLSYNDRGHHFLAKFWLALLHCCENHVTIGGGGEAIQSTSDATDSDDVQVFGASVVG